jgi:hypothetical protein
MCNCSSREEILQNHKRSAKVESPLINKWIIDNIGRKLLVQESIYDIYNDIIGFVTKNSDGQTIRIFESNVKQILD